MLKPNIIAKLIFSALTFSAISGCVTDHSHQPPLSAFEDCKDKKEGAAIQHIMPDGKQVAAICVTSPQGLFARPEHRPKAPPEK